jgi:hypothetical protein
MSPLLKSIEEQARALSAEDRARLAETMLESFQPMIADIEAAWDEEIEERVSAFDQGVRSSHSADAVFAEARQSLRCLAHALLIPQGASFLLKLAYYEDNEPGLGGWFLAAV